MGRSVEARIWGRLEVTMEGRMTVGDIQDLANAHPKGASPRGFSEYLERLGALLHVVTYVSEWDRSIAAAFELR